MGTSLRRGARTSWVAKDRGDAERVVQRAAADYATHLPVTRGNLATATVNTAAVRRARRPTMNLQISGRSLLESNAVTPATMRAYLTAVEGFDRYFRGAPPTTDVSDQLLEFFDHLFAERGWSRSGQEAGLGPQGSQGRGGEHEGTQGFERMGEAITAFEQAADPLASDGRSGAISSRGRRVGSVLGDPPHVPGVPQAVGTDQPARMRPGAADESWHGRGAGLLLSGGPKLRAGSPNEDKDLRRLGGARPPRYAVDGKMVGSLAGQSFEGGRAVRGSHPGTFRQIGQVVARESRSEPFARDGLLSTARRSLLGRHDEVQVFGRGAKERALESISKRGQVSEECEALTGHAKALAVCAPPRGACIRFARKTPRAAQCEVPLWLPSDPLRRKGGFIIELFAGSAGIARASIRRGFGAIAADVLGTTPIDVGSPAFLAWLRWALANLLVLGVWIAPPCSSFSRARRGQVHAQWPTKLRSDAAPMGLEGLPEKEVKLVLEGNRLAAVCVKVVSWCIRRYTPVAIENPDLS